MQMCLADKFFELVAVTRGNHNVEKPLAVREIDVWHKQTDRLKFLQGGEAKQTFSHEETDCKNMQDGRDCTLISAQSKGRSLSPFP